MVQRKRKISPKPGKSREALTITHPNAAGVDIGSSSHYVAVGTDKDDEPVREFSSFTVDLNAMADWLCGQRSLALRMTISVTVFPVRCGARPRSVVSISGSSGITGGFFPAYW